ncbi:MAG: FAD-dependent oxidoreductase [Alphaproteobacteria bacterium]|nr:FAD-dependent oxidoreductase [Alphaproteobacteria bacterium]
MAEVTDVAVVGAGQAGLAASYWLTRQGTPHVVLERGRVGEAWRSQRWDSFCLVTPNWTVQLPGFAYAGDAPDAFMPNADWIAHLDAYAESFRAPVRAGTTVTAVGRAPDGAGFRIATSAGAIDAANVIVAAGTYQYPRMPAFVADLPPETRVVPATAYRNPAALPEGAVLVIGSGQTGCQIAEELNRAGRRVYLATGKTGRVPRRYRGKDCIYWQKLFGYLDRTPDQLASPADRFRGLPHLTGRDGGHTISLHRFARDGIQILGKIEGATGGVLTVAADLADNVAHADHFAAAFCRTVDEYLLSHGIEAPAPGPDNTDDGGAPFRFPSDPIRRLDFDAAGVRTVIVATGFGFDFRWVRFPVFDTFGFPVAERGATAVPGLYFLGLDYLVTRKSGIILGVGEDAADLARQIAARRG